jgi:hypothetical protein
LWSVAFVTVTPPIGTGLRRATGVSFPVRPTCQSTAWTCVVCSWAGNFHATAHRGLFDRAPSSSRRARSSTLMTTPSISYGRRSRPLMIFAKYASISLGDLAAARSSTTGIPSFPRNSIASRWRANLRPTTRPTPWAMNRIWREAVIFGSSCLRLPLVRLRGFM